MSFQAQTDQAMATAVADMEQTQDDQGRML